MRFDLGYGAGAQPVEVPDINLMGVLYPNEIGENPVATSTVNANPVTTSHFAASPVAAGPGPEQLIRHALSDPIGTPPLRQIVSPGEKIVVVTSDVTRPMPTHAVMPILLDELYRAGVKPCDITLVFALGNHRPQTNEERRKLAGEQAYREIRCIDGCSEGAVHLGVTSRGTPVDICRIVSGADRRICLGNIEYHYFAGYSGGVKAIMPGVSTREAIQANHKMMTHPKACTGMLDGNPVRADLEEAISYCPIDFILNVVLDEHKNIVHAVGGHHIDAHREGCRFLDRMYRVGIGKTADIVIVSQGGAPKDLNLYQTQKALDNAKHAVRDGGIIILVGSCHEGMGESTFERWVNEADSPRALIERAETRFELGGHKAAAIALVRERASIYLVSEMPDKDVRRIFMSPYSNVQDAFDDALNEMGGDASVLVMPFGGSTLPTVK